MTNEVNVYTTDPQTARGAATLRDTLYIPSTLEAWGVGFDRQFDIFRQFDEMFDPKSRSYPPYNILRDNEVEGAYSIEIAVAGFKAEELDVELRDSILTVSTKEGGYNPEEDGYTFLHKGIAKRSFARKFALAEHVRVDGVSLENGILEIELRRELPEEKRARKLDIYVSKG